MVGGAIGTALSYVVGSGAILMASTLRDWSPGLFGGYADWQLAFIVMGAPGILLALLVNFTLREPMRRDVVDAGQAFSLTPIFRQLRSNWAAYLAIMGGTVLERDGSQRPDCLAAHNVHPGSRLDGRAGRRHAWDAWPSCRHVQRAERGRGPVVA
jgi:MFS family permease